jgi:pimeloyl-ACP methyl ester carboxylesterase
MVPGLEHRRFASFDSTEIAYQVRGPVGAPVIVLANGLGGTFEAFRHVYSVLGERYRIICWDYRGLYRSGRPRDLSTLSVPYHCRDLELLLAREQVEKAVFIGWSMGVQVNFEYARAHKTQMAGIVAINGTYGNPFRTAMASRLTRYVIPPALALMKAQAPLFSKVSHAALGWEGAIAMMVRFGLVSAEADQQAMFEVAQDFKTVDFGLYSDMLKHLGEHDAGDVLGSLGLPVLIITGDKDILTPVFTARKMNKKIAGSRLVVITGGTHYTPMEYPRIIQDEVSRFLHGVPGWDLP